VLSSASLGLGGVSRDTVNDPLMDSLYPRPLYPPRRVGLGELREEHLSRHGFAGPVAMLYCADGPNEVVRIEGNYRPRQIGSADVVAADATDPRGGPSTLLSNEDVAIVISRRRQGMPYCYRDIDGDLLYFVHRGSGVFATEFGPLHYEPGDYVLLPKAASALPHPPG
jgi:homogentisate 1,2-dioxygenase